ncbi:hypothetical protein IWQ60_004992 [Tieghemiomyces parasiticus]|uniref:Tetratricopeptide repeat protein 1 n=1 Tax=Tieghemiomyces parasiticus TaxID=78921 RepID=A0A9W8A7A4_9FUNG|nr:hypothetical protein IWQ60_004992 [Tieghemiomyces parasiticus]
MAHQSSATNPKRMREESSSRSSSGEWLSDEGSYSDEGPTADDRSCSDEDSYASDESITDEPPTTDEDDSSKSIEEARRIKELGNNHFRAADFDAALNEYEEALRVCPSAELMDLAVLYSNLAACYLKLEKWKDAIECATQSLESQPDFPKALYRRASANLALGTMHSLLEAQSDTSPAVKADCERRLRELPARIDKTHEEEKDKMLGQLKDLGNSLLGKFGMSLDNFQTQRDPATGQTSINFGQKPQSPK